VRSEIRSGLAAGARVVLLPPSDKADKADKADKPGKKA
jgi:hypothetical protein